MAALIGVRARALVALAVVAAVGRPAAASAGDRDDRFDRCVAKCTAAEPAAEASSPLCDGRPAPWTLRTTRWTCEDDCKYECMHAITRFRARSGEVERNGAWKYYGKWVFVRYAGCQEPLSVAFSVANAIPAALFLLRRRDAATDAYPYARAWDVHAALQLHSWAWSAVFHARDTVFTERGDYLAAGANVIFGTALAVVRTFDVRREGKQAACMTAAAFVFATHTAYMLFVKFDYGWNMTVLVTLGVFAAVLWAVWAWRGGVFGLASPPTPRHKDAALMLAVVIGLQCASAFELLDFPPLPGTSLDAHACWHLVTACAAWPWFDWARRDHRVYAAASKQWT